MKTYAKPESTVVVILGAGGDLARRKLVPALYNLWLNRLLPEQSAVIGVRRPGMNDERFRQEMRQAVSAHSRRGAVESAAWDEFARRLLHFGADLTDATAYTGLADRLAQLDKDWAVRANRVFYLAVPPKLIETVAANLANAHLARGDPGSRIVVEKPFGVDLKSACRLNSRLTGLFDERQIYRIDHYLGKETVQNILALRFANSIFEPIWNRRYIDHVQITVAEEVGVEHRGGYYEQAGALRDVVQNHLSQVMCLIAMEPPVSYAADEIRNKKVDVLRAIQPITAEHAHQFAARGQYGAGWLKGQRVPAYRSEPSVAPDSPVETFAAVKHFVDNWRWQGVPFYLRTGKRMPQRLSEAVIQFRPVPHQAFPSAALTALEPNRLVIRIQPQEGVVTRIQAKLPGEAMRLAPVQMRFSYKESFAADAPEAYETLLLDVMLGDATQFMRADQLEAAWRVITPVLEAWESVAPAEFPNYAAGTWGPQSAQVLIAQDGRSWFLPHENGEPAAEAPAPRSAPAGNGPDS